MAYSIEMMQGICGMICQAEQMTKKHSDLLRLVYNKSMDTATVTAKFEGDKPDQVWDVTLDDGDSMIKKIVNELE